MASLETDWVVPKHDTQVHLPSGTLLLLPIIGGATISGSHITACTVASPVITTPTVSGGTVTNSLFSTGTIASATVGTSTITGSSFTGTVSGSVISGCTLTSTNVLAVTSADYVFTGAVASATVSTYASAISPNVVFSFEGQSGTGADAPLISSTQLPAGLRPAHAQDFPIKITLNGTGAWGLLNVASNGTMTFYASAALGNFTAFAFSIEPTTVMWNSVAF